MPQIPYRGGSKRPVVPLRTLTREYYVYDPALEERDYLGGFPVKKRKNDGRLIVVMTDKQASYWIGTGTIGTFPIEQVQGTRREMLHQLSGGRIPLREGDKPSHVVRNARQNPLTMADKITEGYHPALGTTVSSDEERKVSRVRGTIQTSFSDGAKERRR